MGVAGRAVDTGSPFCIRVSTIRLPEAARRGLHQAVPGRPARGHQHGIQHICCVISWSRAASQAMGFCASCPGNPCFSTCRVRRQCFHARHIAQEPRCGSWPRACAGQVSLPRVAAAGCPAVRPARVRCRAGDHPKARAAGRCAPPPLGAHLRGVERAAGAAHAKGARTSPTAYSPGKVVRCSSTCRPPLRCCAHTAMGSGSFKVDAVIAVQRHAGAFICIRRAKGVGCVAPEAARYSRAFRAARAGHCAIRAGFGGSQYTRRPFVHFTVHQRSTCEEPAPWLRQRAIRILQEGQLHGAARPAHRPETPADGHPPRRNIARHHLLVCARYIPPEGGGRQPVLPLVQVAGLGALLQRRPIMPCWLSGIRCHGSAAGAPVASTHGRQ